jgi:hypothetical protein
LKGSVEFQAAFAWVRVAVRIVCHVRGSVKRRGGPERLPFTGCPGQGLYLLHKCLAYLGRDVIILDMSISLKNNRPFVLARDRSSFDLTC